MFEPAGGDPSPVVDRRRFIQALGGGAAAIGLAGCADDGNDRRVDPGPRLQPDPGDAAGSDTAAAAPTVTPAGAAPAVTPTGGRASSLAPALTRLADLELADGSEVHVAEAPGVPPAIGRTDQRIVEIGLEIAEATCTLDPTSGVTVPMWGFRAVGAASADCEVPGPVLRARVGDLVRITLTNATDAAYPHTAEFHAITGPAGGADALTVGPGESSTVNARLLYPGVFMYHCASGDVPMHVAHGMVGMFIVDPEQPLPTVDHEWSIVRSEWYVGQPDVDGLAAFDPVGLLEEHPRYVTLNGRTDALTGDRALRMNVGDRARIFALNAGPNLAAGLQATGAHWDTVYPDGATHPLNPVMRGCVSLPVAAGGGAVAELVGYTAGPVTLVDHALVRTYYKGCIGTIEVEGDDTGIFSVGDAGLAAAVGRAAEPSTSGSAEVVLIPPRAWEPDNADQAYSPLETTVEVGSTVIWRNTDDMVHTVTSGTSDGKVGTSDGFFDSGVMAAGAEFEFTFTEAGTFDYFCQPHPWMIGRVVVEG